MKVLITGVQGQLGTALATTANDDVQLLGYDHSQLDITDAAQVTARVATDKPDWIINTAAYTNVDGAETQIELAMKVNADGAANLAEAAASSKIRMLQVSTDYIFDGEKNLPYKVDDPASPLNVYGRSKLAGERAVQDVLADDALILRTGWLYSRSGNNFVNTMLRLMRQKSSLEVVDDQRGTPTWVMNLARTVWRLIELDASGVQHWSDAGEASWYEFVLAIGEGAQKYGLIDEQVEVSPADSTTVARPARRPAYSVLDKSVTADVLGSQPMRWSSALDEMLSGR